MASQKLIEIWKSNKVQFMIDIARILLVFGLAIIIYILISEIETVKILGSDVCRICMNKTGCSCWCYP